VTRRAVTRRTCLPVTVPAPWSCKHCGGAGRGGAVTCSVTHPQALPPSGGGGVVLSRWSRSRLGTGLPPLTAWPAACWSGVSRACLPRPYESRAAPGPQRHFQRAHVASNPGAHQDACRGQGPLPEQGMRQLRPRNPQVLLPRRARQRHAPFCARPAAAATPGGRRHLARVCRQVSAATAAAAAQATRRRVRTAPAVALHMAPPDPAPAPPHCRHCRCAGSHPSPLSLPPLPLPRCQARSRSQHSSGTPLRPRWAQPVLVPA
jgi:hypothetical protein